MEFNSAFKGLIS